MKLWLDNDLSPKSVPQFMAQACTDYLEQHRVRISVSDVASPWQNGYIESFFGRFKQEFGDMNRFETAGEMPPAVFAAQAVIDNGLHILGT
jgi:transposase InsO family protein